MASVTQAEQRRLETAYHKTQEAAAAVQEALALVKTGKATPAQVQKVIDRATAAKKAADAALRGSGRDKALELGPRGKAAETKLSQLTAQFQTTTKTGKYAAIKTNAILPYGSQGAAAKTSGGRGGASSTPAGAGSPAPATRDGAADAGRSESAGRDAGGAPPTDRPRKEANVGAFGPMPRATPKYATNRGNRSHYRDTTARMYLWLSPREYGRVAQLAEEAARYDSRIKALTARLAVRESNNTEGYIEFLLQEAAHNHNEKIEVVESLAHKHSLYVFGAEPPVYNYAAFLLNNKQDDQAANLQRLYWLFLRAGQLAHLRTQVHLQYNEMLVSGVLTNLQLTLHANDESFQRAAFQLIVRSVKLLDSDDSANTYNPGYSELSPLADIPGALSVKFDWPQTQRVGVGAAPPRTEEHDALQSLDATAEPATASSSGGAMCSQAAAN